MIIKLYVESLKAWFGWEQIWYLPTLIVFNAVIVVITASGHYQPYRQGLATVLVNPVTDFIHIYQQQQTNNISKCDQKI